MSIHSRPLLASLLATMLRAQSSSVSGDSRSQRLTLLLEIVVSVMTCIMSYSYSHYDGGTSCDTGCTHHASAGLVEIVERKRDGRVGGKGHEHGGNRQSSVAACAADAVRQMIALVDA